MDGTSATDPFEARLQLVKQLRNLRHGGSEKTIKGCVGFCMRMQPFAEDMVACILDELGEEKTTVRLAFQILEELLGIPSYFLHIERVWKRISRTGGHIPGAATMVLEWNRRYGWPLGEDQRLQAEQAVAGLHDEKIPRKKALEVMEREREGHKKLREECWLREETEGSDQEFEEYWKTSMPFERRDYEVMQSDQNSYHELMGTSGVCRGKRKHNFEDRILIAPLEEMFLHVKRFLSVRASNAEAAVAQQLDQMIRKVASKLFFYEDLVVFDQQPHVYYYAEEDDGRSLEDYGFESDQLGRFAREGVKKTERLYRERAYRFRQICQAYAGEPLELLRPSDRDAIERLLRDLDRATNSINYQTAAILRAIVRHSHIHLIIWTDEPLPRLLAKASIFKLNHLMPADHFYNHTKYGKEWCLREIIARFGSQAQYAILGNLSEDQKLAESFGMEYVRIKNSGDLDSFSRHCLEV